MDYTEITEIKEIKQNWWYWSVINEENIKAELAVLITNKNMSKYRK